MKVSVFVWIGAAVVAAVLGGCTGEEAGLLPTAAAPLFGEPGGPVQAQGVPRAVFRTTPSDVEGIVDLFTEDAQVVSPFLGHMSPRPFFDKVRDASGQSRIEVLDILLSAQGASRAMAYFVYHWQLRDGTEVRFDCVDVFDFNEQGRIQRMTIVYDTHPVRALVGDKYA